MLTLDIFDTSDVVLTVINISIDKKILWPWHGITLGLEVGLFNISLNLLLQSLKFSLSSEIIQKDQFSDLLNTISLLSDLLNFLSGSVGITWIRHRMSVVSIGITFNQKWTVFNSVLFSPLESLSDSKEIISINSESWDLISSGEEIRILG